MALHMTVSRHGVVLALLALAIVLGPVVLAFLLLQNEVVRLAR